MVSIMRALIGLKLITFKSIYLDIEVYMYIVRGKKSKKLILFLILANQHRILLF